ncbi:MAG: hypothetical protein ACAI25_09145, partial [Planctomycetota bacterium]
AHPPSWGDHRDGPERQDLQEARYNALVRVATARWLEEVGAFRTPPTTVANASAPAETASPLARAARRIINMTLGD